MGRALQFGSTTTESLQPLKEKSRDGAQQKTDELAGVCRDPQRPPACTDTGRTCDIRQLPTGQPERAPGPLNWLQQKSYPGSTGYHSSTGIGSTSNRSLCFFVILLRKTLDSSAYWIQSGFKTSNTTNPSQSKWMLLLRWTINERVKDATNLLFGKTYFLFSKSWAGNMLISRIHSDLALHVIFVINVIFKLHR